MATKVTLNLAGIRELKADPGGEAFMRSLGERVLAAAKASAPVDTGAYRAGLALVVENHPISGAVAHVGGSAPHTFLVESRTGNLARALGAAGGA